MLESNLIPLLEKLLSLNVQGFQFLHCQQLDLPSLRPLILWSDPVDVRWRGIRGRIHYDLLDQFLQFRNQPRWVRLGSRCFAEAEVQAFAHDSSRPRGDVVGNPDFPLVDSQTVSSCGDVVSVQGITKIGQSVCNLFRIGKFINLGLQYESLRFRAFVGDWPW